MPMVSIIMPAHNARKHIGEALRSVVAQTFKDWEMIVVEDGSGESSKDIAEDFKKGSKNPVLYLEHEKNKGISCARNTGIRSAGGEHVAFLDSDDYWKPTHLESVMACFNNDHIGMVHSGSIVFDDSTKNTIDVRVPGTSPTGSIERAIYGGGYIIQPSSVVLRKGLFKAIGYFDPNSCVSEDLDLWIRIIRSGYKIIYSNKLTCHYRKHSEAITSDSPRLVKYTGLIYYRHMDWKALPWIYRHSVTAKTLQNAGRMYFKANPKESAGLFFLAYRAMPFNIINLIYALIALIISPFNGRRGI